MIEGRPSIPHEELGYGPENITNIGKKKHANNSHEGAKNEYAGESSGDGAYLSCFISRRWK